MQDYVAVPTVEGTVLVLRPCLDLELWVNDMRMKSLQNLGFLFDHQMDLEYHQMDLEGQVNVVSPKCYLNQRNVSRVASKLSRELKVQLVHSNILCFIDYCNFVYCRLTQNEHE